MTVKKMRRVAEEPSPSPSYRDDARKRFRFQSLSQDYAEFLEETEKKKRRLLEARLRKRKLFAETSDGLLRFKAQASHLRENCYCWLSNSLMHTDYQTVPRLQWH